MNEGIADSYILGSIGAPANLFALSSGSLAPVMFPELEFSIEMVLSLLHLAPWLRALRRL